MTADRRLMSYPRGEDNNQTLADGRAEHYRGSMYEIRIAGHLDKTWSDWLGGMEITHDEVGYTRLAGPIVDQAALYGTLAKIRDLGLALVSLNPREIRAREKDIN